MTDQEIVALSIEELTEIKAHIKNNKLWFKVCAVLFGGLTGALIGFIVVLTNVNSSIQNVATKDNITSGIGLSMDYSHDLAGKSDKVDLKDIHDRFAYKYRDWVSSVKEIYQVRSGTATIK